MIDTHCHFDMIPNPEDYITRQELLGNTIIGMTNLPSHFKMGRPYIQGFRHIRLALGYHPLYAATHKNEIRLFIQQSKYTSYIGEIGLDFSREGVATKSEQMSLLDELLSSIDYSKKIVSVHSRGAEKELLTSLKKHQVKNVIFHWYSGPLSLINDIIDAGYYFSINEYMTLSKNGESIIQHIPHNRIITETDAPYNRKSSLQNATEYLNTLGVDIDINFKELLRKIR